MPFAVRQRKPIRPPPEWQVAKRSVFVGYLGPRPTPVVVSMIGHAIVLAMVAMAPAEMALPERTTAYDQLIAGHEQKLVFYRLKDKLPNITPPKAADRRPPRAEVKIEKQSIVSSPKDAPKATQMVWQPAPELKIQRDLQSPNLLALKLPQIQRPEVERKPAREFVPPRPVRRAPKATPIDIPVPDVKVASANPKQALDKLGNPLPAKASWRTFEPPTPKPRAAREIAVLPNAPALSADASSQNRYMQKGLGSLPQVSKPFVPPAAKPSVAGAMPVLPGEPGPLADGALNQHASNAQLAKVLSTSQMNAAIIGLNPSDRMKDLPSGSRPAQFSAGPEVRPDGGSGANDGARISVPDLMVRGTGRDPRPALMAKLTPPTSTESLRASAKYLSVSAIGHPSARIAASPDPRFEGRQVFTTAIQMPNITSYVGSWLMWYAGREDSKRDATILPPIPHRKVDPKYIAAAVEEHVEGTVRLACVIRRDGSVSSVEIVKGVDERLDRSATEALLKWQFTPATQESRPVDVDVLVDIPFRLAPTTASR